MTVNLRHWQATGTHLPGPSSKSGRRKWEALCDLVADCLCPQADVWCPYPQLYHHRLRRATPDTPTWAGLITPILDSGEDIQNIWCRTAQTMQMGILISWEGENIRHRIPDLLHTWRFSVTIDRQLVSVQVWANDNRHHVMINEVVQRLRMAFTDMHIQTDNSWRERPIPVSLASIFSPWRRHLLDPTAPSTPVLQVYPGAAIDDYRDNEPKLRTRAQSPWQHQPGILRADIQLGAIPESLPRALRWGGMNRRKIAAIVNRFREGMMAEIPQRWIARGQLRTQYLEQAGIPQHRGVASIEHDTLAQLKRQIAQALPQ